ncbi:MAG: hypothetical protein H7Y18_20080 [Clostridiaceae bacterium]|nr:hypothetical protein [Clostridiaceae bacterium]
MELRRFFNSVGRMIWLVILLGVIGGGCAYYTSYYITTSIYEAETTVYAMSKGSTLNGNDSINYQDVMLSRQLVQDYQEIIASEKVRTLAVNQLKKYGISQERLQSMIRVEPKNESSIIGIVAVSENPQLAADASNAVTQAFVTRLRELTNNNIVGVLDEARLPQFPITNNATKKILIGIIAGIVIAVSIIYIRELFDTTIRLVDDVEDSLKIKVFGVIPKYSIR